MSSSGKTSSSSSVPTLAQVASSLPSDFLTLINTAGVTPSQVESLANSAGGNLSVFVPQSISGVEGLDKLTAGNYVNAHISLDGGVTDASGKCIQSTTDSNGNITVDGQAATAVTLKTSDLGTFYTAYIIGSPISKSREPNADGTCSVSGSMGSMDM